MVRGDSGDMEDAIPHPSVFLPHINFYHDLLPNGDFLSLPFFDINHDIQL